MGTFTLAYLKQWLLTNISCKWLKSSVIELSALVIVFGFFITVLTSCGGSAEERNIPIPQVPIDQTATGDLVLFVPDYSNLSDTMRRAIDIFRATYPHVNLDIEFFGTRNMFTPEIDAAYRLRLNNDLMVGTGADVIMFTSEMFQDIHKAMDAGVFLNLSPIMEETGFSMDGLNETVMDAGSYRGGRYFMPFAYFSPLLITSQGRLDSIGFDMSRGGDFISFFDEIDRALPMAMENPSFNDIFGVFPFEMLLAFSGISIVDYETRAILPDEDGFRAFIEVYKRYRPLGNAAVERGGRVDPLSAVITGHSIFIPVVAGLARDTFMHSAIKNVDTPVVMGLPNINGGMTSVVVSGLAIRAGTPNQLNAWNFIRIMLSEEVQTFNPLHPFSGFPVNNAALMATTDSRVRHATNPLLNMGNLPLTALDDDDLAAHLALHETITDSQVLTSEVANIIYVVMEPFFNDDMSLDDAIPLLRSRLAIYVSE